MSKNNKQRSVVPRLRFPEFAGEPLRRLQLGDVTEDCTERNGKGAISSPIMGVSKVDGIVPMEERLIGKDTARYKCLETNWFAYNPMRLNIGSIARWEGHGTVLVSPDYVVFRCVAEREPSINPDYLDHFRCSDQWERFVGGSGDGGVRIRIYYKDLAQLPITLPSLGEQKQIADCLGSLDDLIAAEGRELAALRDHKKGLLQQLFPREGETRPQLRFPEFRDAGEWKSKTLEHLCDLKAGDFVRAADIAEICGEGMFPCYGGNGLRGYVSTYTHSGRFVLIGRQGALCGNVNLFDEKFHATEHALVATPKANIYVDWLYYALTGLNLNRFAIGQAQPGLSVSVLKGVDVSVPKDEGEQHCIADCLSTLDATITAQAEKLNALRTHKRGLMQQLFPIVEGVA